MGSAFSISANLSIGNAKYFASIYVARLNPTNSAQSVAKTASAEDSLHHRLWVLAGQFGEHLHWAEERWKTKRLLQPSWNADAFTRRMLFTPNRAGTTLGSNP
jgi:hypothetical protein